MLLPLYPFLQFFFPLIRFLLYHSSLFHSPLFHSCYFTPVISLPAISPPAISLPTISLPAISLPTISLPLFHSTLFHPCYFTPRYFTPCYFTPRYFTPCYFTPRYLSSNYFPRSFPPSLNYPFVMACPVIPFSAYSFQPFHFHPFLTVIFFRATFLSAILLSSSQKIPLFYSHLHFSSQKTVLNIFPLPNPSEISSPFFHHLACNPHQTRNNSKPSLTIHKCGSIPHLSSADISIHARLLNNAPPHLIKAHGLTSYQQRYRFSPPATAVKFISGGSPPSPSAYTTCKGRESSPF